MSPAGLGSELTWIASCWDVWGIDVCLSLNVWGHGARVESEGGAGGGERCAVCTYVRVPVPAGLGNSCARSSERRAGCKQQLMSVFVVRCVEVHGEL